MDEVTSAIQESIADLPGSEAETSVDTSTPDTSTPSTTPDVAAASGDAPPDSATDGLTPSPKPMSRSQQRITQLVEQGKAKEAEWTAKHKALEDRIEANKWAFEDPHAKVYYDGMRLAETDRERFAQIITGLPEFQGLLALKQAQEAAAAAAPASDQPPALPDPDIDLGNGTAVHSQEIISKFLRDSADYSAAQAEKRIKAELAELRGLVQPVINERKDKVLLDVATVQQNTAWENVVSTYGADIADDTTKGEMHAWLKTQWAQNKRAGIPEAVNAVLVPKMKRMIADARKDAVGAADKARRSTIADSNARAAAAERPSAIIGEVEEDGDPITNAIKGAIAGLPR